MSPNGPFVSIIVPVYNDASYLDDSLGSIQAQTFGNFEVIVSDDFSEDASARIAVRFSSEDPRFRVVTNPRNLGMTRNWNAALSLAAGEWVMKVDADDVVYPNMIDAMLGACERRGTDVAFCRTEYCDESLNTLGPYKGEDWLDINGIDPGEEWLLDGEVWYQWCFDDRQLWHSNAFVAKRALLQKIGGWDERWGCASDTDLILRLLETAKGVVHVPYVGVRYRVREGSVSDHYRRNTWLSRETAAIHLLSLARRRQDGRSLNWHLRRNWFRFWRIWKETGQLGGDEECDLPAAFGLELAPPPLSVRMMGESYDWVSRLKRCGLPWSSRDT